MKHVTIVGTSSKIYEKIVHRVIEQACKVAHCQKDTTVSIVFIEDKKIRQLNRKYRGKDQTTNVLAFATEQRSNRATKQRVDLLFSRSGIQLNNDLGDIFICLPEAKREAKKYGWSVKHSVARLALHGFLHLLAYDHIKEKEARKMEEIEKKILYAFH